MEILSTKDISTYLNINEKKIYQLVKDGEIPHTRIGGKIIFTREIIDHWIHENTELERNILIAGSDDILLKEIIDHLNFAIQPPKVSLRAKRSNLGFHFQIASSLRSSQ